MKPKLALMLCSLGFATACWSQSAQRKSLPDSCTKVVRVHGAFPKGPFKKLSNETYTRSPMVKYQIEEDGKVTNAMLIRSSGVASIDKAVVDAMGRWKYQPRPKGCGQIETEMSVTIDWASPD
jgi:TonB family protein